MTYNWFVIVNDEGIQGQVLAGNTKLAKQAAKEQKSLEKKAKIKYIFEYRKDPDSYQNRAEFKTFLGVDTKKLHKKVGAWDPVEFSGYETRKRASIGNGLEVLAELEAKDSSEFQRDYSGIDGAIDVLLSAVRILSGNYDREEPGKSIMKLVRKLEIEKE